MEVLLFPFALLISASGSAVLVSRSLNPIRQVIATARKINSGNLRQRLLETSSGDEIQELTRTLNQMLDRLEASFKQMIQFTADASHELRTPLTVIRGNLELVLRNKTGWLPADGRGPGTTGSDPRRGRTALQDGEPVDGVDSTGFG